MQAAKKSSVVDFVVEQILEAVRSGEFVPGKRIPSERELTQSMNVSRTALREGVKRLQSMGILTVRQGDGTYINSEARQQEVAYRQELNQIFSLGNVTVQDFVEARCLVETRAASLAIERSTDREFDGLAAIFEQMEKNVNNPEQFAQCDLQFHQELVRLSKNPVLMHFEASINELLKTQVYRSIATQEALTRSLNAHQEILKSLYARNPRKAELAVRGHLQKITERLSEFVASRSRNKFRPITVSDVKKTFEQTNNTGVSDTMKTH